MRVRLRKVEVGSGVRGGGEWRWGKCVVGKEELGDDLSTINMNTI